MPRTMLRIMFFGGLAWIAAELIKRFFGLNLVDVVFFGIAGLVVFSVFSVAEFFQKQARELQQLRGDVKSLNEVIRELSEFIEQFAEFAMRLGE